MSAFSEHYDKKHLELLFAVHRVRMPRRHNDRLSLVNKIRLAVYPPHLILLYYARDQAFSPLDSIISIRCLTCGVRNLLR